MIDYIDTSVLVAGHTVEAKTGDVDRWFDSRASTRWVISDWVATSSPRPSRLKLRSGAIGPTENQGLALFHQLIDDSFEIVPVTPERFRTAARFADRHELALRGGDALHLAIADGESARLVT